VVLYWSPYRSFVAAQYSIALSFNVFTDYLSLFVIRWLLSRSGTKVVVGLILAAISGSAIVLLANVLRAITFFIQRSAWFGQLKIFWENVQDIFFGIFYSHMHYALPAIIVFSWLPLFALGILAIRALTPLSRIVEKAQWALKEGDKHPLKAIGYVAAVVVFELAVGLRATATA
jgi:hypothetical protein